ncbi:Uncharacterised protein [Chlamydia trachomatis]|nr:Uncharacterised protein [Chlamydia trachomatis]
MKVVVDQSFWDVFPEAQIAVLSVKGLDNHVDEIKDPYFQGILTEAAQKAQAFIQEDNFTENDVIKEWREAQRTMLTEETKDAILVIEAINAVQIARANEAVLALQALVADYFGVTGEIAHLTTENPETTV